MRCGQSLRCPAQPQQGDAPEPVRPLVIGCQAGSRFGRAKSLIIPPQLVKGVCELAMRLRSGSTISALVANSRAESCCPARFRACARAKSCALVRGSLSSSIS